VLLVEDDTIDAMTVQRAFRDLKLANPVQRVVGGEEALAHLRDPAHDEPCLILLDLNMPKMNGIELLAAAKADPVLRRIPIVVLTTSRDMRDIVECFRLSAAGYVIKPVDYREFIEAIRTICQYWTLSESPRQDAETSPVLSPVHSAGPSRSC